MAVFTYSRVAALNPNTAPVSVAKSASGSLYDINDTGFLTPLNLTLVATNAVTTTLFSDANGIFPDFTLLDRTSCVFKSSAGVPFVLTTTTPVPGPTGAPGAAGKHVAAATASAGNLVLALDDGTILPPVPLPTASAIDDSSAANLVANGAATKAALNATYAPKGTTIPKWVTATAYTAGQQVISPNGDAVSSIADHTSGATFNPANWNLSPSFATPAQAFGNAIVAAIVLGA